MTILRTIRDQDVGLLSLPFVLKKERFAARAVLRMNQKIALMYIARDNYYKLPGGGIDDGEAVLTALHRELLEEVGAAVTVTAELGEIIEERSTIGFRQHSYCFLAEQTGELAEPTLTTEEAASGMRVVWMDSIEQAIERVEDSSPGSGGSTFMKERDATILRAAQAISS